MAQVDNIRLVPSEHHDSDDRLKQSVHTPAEPDMPLIKLTALDHILIGIIWMLILGGVTVYIINHLMAAQG